MTSTTTSTATSTTTTSTKITSTPFICPSTMPINTASACIQSANNCVEGNLDVQYLLATARGAVTTWWYTEDQHFSDFFTAVYNTPNPPSVYSVRVIFSIAYSYQPYHIPLPPSSIFSNDKLSTPYLMHRSPILLTRAASQPPIGRK